MPDPKLTNFTFGVEIEFILPYQPPDDDDPRFEDEIEDELHDLCIRKPLERAGLQVHSNEVDVSDETELLYSKWSVQCDGSVKFTQEDFDRIDGTFANGVKVNDIDDLNYVSVELISPVLTYSAEAMREVHIAVETICKLPIVVPRSAGLHVHIGNGNARLPLLMLKNLAVLTSCFEQQWNQATPPHRLNNPHCHLPRHAFFAKDYDRVATAKAIYELPDIDSLVRKFHVPPMQIGLKDPYLHVWSRNKAIDYLNQVFWVESDEKKTVEFRQQAGTVDPFEVLRWIVTVGTMAAIANEHEPEFFWKVIQKHVRPNGTDDLTFSLLELFKDFDVEWLGRLWEHGRLYIHDEYCPNRGQKSQALPSSGDTVQLKKWPGCLLIMDEQQSSAW